MINSETNKDFTNKNKSLKEIYDKIDCLQRSQVYHVTEVESSIKSNLNDLKSLLLRRLADVESCDVHMVEVN